MCKRSKIILRHPRFACVKPNILQYKIMKLKMEITSSDTYIKISTEQPIPIETSLLQQFCCCFVLFYFVFSPARQSCKLQLSWSSTSSSVGW